MNMRKYLQVFSVTVKEYFAYRLNFVLWRVRSVMNLIVTYFLWNAILANRNSFGSYGKNNLLSYIIFVNLIVTFVMGTRTAEIAGEINNGNIINLLLKPIDFFKYYLFRDLADKAVNIFFAIGEITLFVILFKVPLVTPQNLGLFFLLFVSGTLISFYINLMLSFIGFWTTEVWAPRFVFFMIVSFLSGAYFPLDLLPATVYKLFLLTPFPYLYYLPAKILVGKLDTDILWEIAMSFIWIFLISQLTRLMWSKGNRNFSFWGR
jgi:ABC-2 type transport system permease protein